MPVLSTQVLHSNCLRHVVALRSWHTIRSTLWSQRFLHLCSFKLKGLNVFQCFAIHERDVVVEAREHIAPSAGVHRWYNTPWTMTAFHAFLNFSMLQARRRRLDVRSKLVVHVVVSTRARRGSRKRLKFGISPHGRRPRFPGVRRLSSAVESFSLTAAAQVSLCTYLLQPHHAHVRAPTGGATLEVW